MRDTYLSLLEKGLVLAPRVGRKAQDKKFPAYTGRSYTMPTELDAWLYAGNDIGLLCGKYSRTVAIEVLNMRGSLVLDVWSHNRLPPTWEFMGGTGSKFYIYKTPSDFAVAERATFESQNLGKGALPDLVVWGQDACIPLPQFHLGFDEVRHPRMGDLPIAPRWLLRTLEANTVRQLEPLRYKSFVPLWAERNLIRFTGARIEMSRIYDVYQKESLDAGQEPHTEEGLRLRLKRLSGIKFFRDRTKANQTMRYYARDVMPKRFSTLDLYTRS